MDSAERFRSLVGGYRAQTDLAEALGEDIQVINNWTRRGVPARKARRVADYFGVRTQWLLDGEEPKSSGHPPTSRALAASALEAGERAPRNDSHHLVPQFDVLGAMGDGTFVSDHIDVVRHISVNIEQLRRQCSFTSPQNLSFITGYGNSMEPTFKDGDVLLIDTGVNTVDVDGVYVLHLNGKLYIKTLQRWPDGTIQMISDSRPQTPYTIKESDQTVINGRVVLAWNARRL